MNSGSCGINSIGGGYLADSDVWSLFILIANSDRFVYYSRFKHTVIEFEGVNK